MTTNRLPLNKIILCFLAIAISFNCLAQSPSKNEQSIKGKLKLDSIWNPIAYLSYIPSFKDMYTMSNDMIIAKSTIDSLGNFTIATSMLLPNKDNLYRLHISKIGAPAASLIIGGDEENHIFFIANSSSEVFIGNDEGDRIFYNYTIDGYNPNRTFKQAYDLVKQIEQSDFNNSSVKLSLTNQDAYEQLKTIADTSTHSIASLYALNNSNFETTFLSNQAFYEGYLKKWKGENSTYFNEFRSKFPKNEPNTLLWVVIIGVSGFILGFVIQYFYNHKGKKKNNQLKQLSVQERKIFNLIRDGKSNKEISEQLSIGLSTVKSHVSNIFSKLNIKSRKEVMDFT